MTAPSWTDVEKALHAWAVAGSGLAADHVLWAQQGAPRPTGACVLLRIMSVRRLGRDWVEIEDDGSTTTFTARGVRQGVLSIQCFDGAATGATGALQLLHRLISSLELPSIRERLRAGGVGVAAVEDALSIDGVVNTVRFEPRATCQVRFFLASEISETTTEGGVIERAEIAGLEPVGDCDTPVDELLVFDVPPNAS